MCSKEWRNALSGARLVLGALGFLMMVACSSGGGGGGNSQGSGGSGTSATGGVTASGGSTTATGGSGSGGTLGSGGSASTGGVTGSGGGSGGVTASGGTSSAGGAASGGTTGMGGASLTGGSTTVASGGSTSRGGATGSGGAASGGSTGNGGAAGAASGGATTVGAGGASARGGATGSGGAATGGTTTTGAGGTTDCKGHAISLSANGTGSAADTAFAHVEVDLKTDLPIGNAKRTVEFWAYIKSTDWVGEKNQIFYYGGTDATGSFGLDFGTNNVTGSTTNHATLNPFTGSAIRDDSGKDLGIDSSTDQWVHIAMTWDGTVLTTYVNGLPKITAQGSGSTTTLNTAQSVIMIGCNPTNNNCFNGYFDELRVWNVARTATEIKDNYTKVMVGNETGLVGYYKFDETSGTTTADSVTTAGHTAHPGTLKADTAAHNPTFVVPATAVPLVCS
jgi:hypothetical protein